MLYNTRAVASRTDIALSPRSALEGIARGATLDVTLRGLAQSVFGALSAGSCKIWLVKQGDICERCAMARSCENRTMCLHLKVAIPEGRVSGHRVPLEVFRDRAVAKGGCGRVGDPRGSAGMLFAPEEVAVVGGDAFAAVPLTGPAGVLGLLGILRATPLSLDEVDALAGFADEAVVAVRIADLTSRYQRALMQLEDAAETRADVEGLLHSILYGSSEYDVIAEDLEGNVTVFSEGARTTYGYEPDELIGRVKADVLYAPEEIESGRIVEILTEAMSTGRCEAVVMRLRKNGERFPARATFTVRRDAEGDPSGFVIVERDLTIERTSARMTESSMKHVAELQDHLLSLKSTNALLEDDMQGLRSENSELRGRLQTVSELEDLNTIRDGIIRELRAKLEALSVAPDPPQAAVDVDAPLYEDAPDDVAPEAPSAPHGLSVVTYTPRDRIAFSEDAAGAAITVTQFDNARVALNTAANAQRAVLVVDVQAPDGWAMLTAANLVEGAPPVVAIGPESDRGRALAACAWAYVPRPVTREDFAEAVWRAGDRKPTRVLLVASDNAVELSAAFKHASVEFLRIDNWRIARDRLVRGDVDVLVVDGSDPRIRGLEILDWLAGEPAYFNYPIVLLTPGHPESIASRLTGARPADVVERKSVDRAVLLGACDRAVLR